MTVFYCVQQVISMICQESRIKVVSMDLSLHRKGKRE